MKGKNVISDLLYRTYSFLLPSSSSANHKTHCPPNFQAERLFFPEMVTSVRVLLVMYTRLYDDKILKSY